MGWFTKKEAAPQEPLADIWHVCPKCQAHVFKDEWISNQMVCPKCGHHDRLTCRQRVEMLIDPDTFREFGTEIVPSDPLKFSDAKGPYAPKAAATVKKLGQSESVIIGSGNIRKGDFFGILYQGLFQFLFQLDFDLIFLLLTQKRKLHNIFSVFLNIPLVPDKKIFPLKSPHKQY